MFEGAVSRQVLSLCYSRNDIVVNRRSHSVARVESAMVCLAYQEREVLERVVRVPTLTDDNERLVSEN